MPTQLTARGQKEQQDLEQVVAEREEEGDEEQSEPPDRVGIPHFRKTSFHFCFVFPSIRTVCLR